MKYREYVKRIALRKAHPDRPIIDPSYVKRISDKIDKIQDTLDNRGDFVTLGTHIYGYDLQDLGTVGNLISKADNDIAKAHCGGDVNLDLAELTDDAFTHLARVQPDVMAVYSEAWNVGYIVSSGDVSVWYDEFCTDQDMIDTDPETIMPEGAEDELDDILHNRDPFVSYPTPINIAWHRMLKRIK